MYEADGPWLTQMVGPLQSAKTMLVQLEELEGQVTQHGKEESLWETKLAVSFDGLDRVHNILGDLGSCLTAPMSNALPLWPLSGPEVPFFCKWEAAVSSLTNPGPAAGAADVDALTLAVVDPNRLDSFQKIIDHTYKLSKDRISQLSKYEQSCQEARLMPACS
jgi:hypothetical protein